MEFKCDKMRYFFEINIMSIFYILFIIASALFLSAGMMRIIMTMVFVVSFYSLWNNIIAKNNIEKIEIDDDYIAFSALGKKKEHYFNEIKDIRIKQYPVEQKLYIRIQDKNKKKYKYYVNIPYFSDNIVLVDELINIVKTISPDRRIYNTSIMKELDR